MHQCKVIKTYLWEKGCENTQKLNFKMSRKILPGIAVGSGFWTGIVSKSISIKDKQNWKWNPVACVLLLYNNQRRIYHGYCLPINYFWEYLDKNKTQLDGVYICVCYLKPILS